MSWRRIAITYGLALALGLYIYTVERTRGGEVAIDVVAVPPILPILSTRVTDLTVTVSDRELHVTRDGERWAVVTPKGAQITNDLVTATIETLSTIAPIEVVDEGDGDASDYGLEFPAVLLRIQGDGKDIHLALGGRNPTRTAVYAKRTDEQPIYLLGLAARYYVELLIEELDESLGL